MIPRDLIKKVRKIEIVTRHYVQDYMAGQYHSIFKGRGMSFQEVRQYQIGDDIRLIDWNVSARMGDCFVKLFVEEREMTVILLVDISASTLFGTRGVSKREVIAEVAALLSFSAIENNDRVGLIMFTDRIEKFIPPKKGRKHVLRVVLSLLHERPVGKGTDISVALDYLGKVIRRRSVVFLISDFIGSDCCEPLKLAAKRHDLIPVEIFDPREKPPVAPVAQEKNSLLVGGAVRERRWRGQGDAGIGTAHFSPIYSERGLTAMGIVLLEDPETGETAWVDTSCPTFRSHYSKALKVEELARGDFFRRNKIDSIQIEVGRPYLDPLLRFFSLRAKRARIRV